MHPASELGGIPLLQQRPFRMLSFTRFSSRIASNALNFALVLIVVEQTGQAFQSSVLVLTLVVPSTVVAIVAGQAADTFPKRLLVFVADIARVAVCVLFIAGSSAGPVACYLAAIGLSTFGQFASSTEGAILPAIVTRAELTRANAIGEAVGGIAQLLGLAVLAPLALRVPNGANVLFGVCALLFAVAAIQAVFIGSTRSSARQEVGGGAEGHWWLAGWRQMQIDATVMRAAVELTLIAAALIILSGIIPKFIKDVLDLPIDVGAIVLSPAAIGVILGLRIAGFLAHRVPHALLSTVGFMAFAVNLAMVAFVRQEASFLGGYGMFGFLNHVNIGSFDGAGLLAMILVLPLGFWYSLVAVAGRTLLNDRVPLSLQGRVLSTQAAMSAIVSSLPVLAAGALADWVGVTPVMAILAGVTGAAAVVNIRTRDTHPTPIRSSGI